ncbi:hypothetical protein GCK72_008425 [Caenorhabditis remanei]|uniref:Anticodon-binding domain-containing protein n=1 Tax=Caenorhabditis remanei TaxID=31234 RepID=A0A6A5GZQ8_CAERE|nr:hypothetical protein GCK72_008425 [Caenorhabditis remanei]KAF1760179.1 hypothetical protein GCK72_008425 [Caenorhabditis remanei]
MCEIEHFVDPEDKSFSKFAKIADQKLVLLSACDQLDGAPAREVAIGEAVANKTVANETLGYYMARCHQFLMKIGIDDRRLRFRQHLSNEMAHYAQDSWDAEILTSYGWIECVGNADKACYDLQQHFKATNGKLDKRRMVDVNVVEAEANMALLGKSFKKDSKKIQTALQKLSSEQVSVVEWELRTKNVYNLDIKGENYALTPDLLNIKKYSKKMYKTDVIPAVIKSAYDVGRILYSVLEHSFRQREGDEQRTFLAFKPLVAPIKCSILPISANETLVPVMEAVKEELARYELCYKVDDSSGTIGRRYARTDEIGIPFGITVDFDSDKTTPHTVTIRHVETMSQIRLPISELGRLISDLVAGRQQWSDAQAKYPRFEANAE